MMSNTSEKTIEVILLTEVTIYLIMNTLIKYRIFETNCTQNCTQIRYDYKIKIIYK